MNVDGQGKPWAGLQRSQDGAAARLEGHGWPPKRVQTGPGLALTLRLAERRISLNAGSHAVF